MQLPKSLVGFYVSVFRERRWGMIAYYIVGGFYRATTYILPAMLVKFLVGALEQNGPGQITLWNVMPVLVGLSVWILMYLASDLVNHLLEVSVYPRVKKASHVKMYRYLIEKSFAFYKNYSTGYLAKQAEAIINSTWGMMFKYPVRLVAIILGVVMNFGLLFDLSWTFAGLIAMALTFRVLHAGLRMRSLARSYADVSHAASVVAGKSVDVLSNFLNLKIFGDERNERKYVGDFYDEWVVAKRHSLAMEFKFFSAPLTIESLTLILIIYIMTYFYTIGRMDLSEIAFVISAFFSVRSCIVNFVWELPDFMDDYSNADQAYRDLTKTAPTLACVQTGDKPCRYTSQIKFENVSFKYEDQWVLRDINLCIKKGEKVGIVGPSGSGKTTLVNLVMHLYDATDGRVLIDDTDIRKFRATSLKRVVAFVPQESILFNRTLAENISYGCGNHSRADIIRAAKLAHAHDFIMRLEHGYDTIVGDRGIKLSGGQRQRISIAHAILKNSPILLLDEATSALDSETEAAIQKSLDTLMAGRTTIAIAHRLSTLKQMDRIIVMDRGRIIEQGTHAQLMRLRGMYWKLWNLQYSGFM